MLDCVVSVKEVGRDWVSLVLKRPESKKMSQIITYKVEAWLCGEGAYWVEVREKLVQFSV